MGYDNILKGKNIYIVTYLYLTETGQAMLFSFVGYLNIIIIIINYYILFRYVTIITMGLKTAYTRARTTKNNANDTYCIGTTQRKKISNTINCDGFINFFFFYYIAK